MLSNHPSLPRSFSAVMFISVAAALTMSIAIGDGAVADEIKGVPAVKVQEPRRGSLPNLINAYGTATPTSGATVTESFQRDGRVSEIFVEVGDQFKAGDRLLDFGASPAAVVAYEQAKTGLAVAEHALERKQQMLKQRLATQEEAENAQKAVADARLAVAMYEKIGSIKPAEILAAPFDGVVTAIAVTKGDRISAGAPLMTLSRTDQIILSVGVEPSALDKVKPGLPVHLTSLLPDRKPIEGTVKQIGAAVDPKTRQIPVQITLPPQGALAGENFKAAIEIGQFQGWIVPRRAIGSTSKNSFVFQVGEKRARQVRVFVLGSVGKTSVVEGDIDPQELLVLSGNYQVNDGDAVRPEVVAPGDEGEG